MRAWRRPRSLLLTVGVAACDGSSPDRARPVPTPGPQAVVREVVSLSGGARVERGERLQFAVVGTGSGTHFDAGTFLHQPAFEELQVIAVESSARLIAQGLVSIAAGTGPKDLAVVSGDELAVAPWAFEVTPSTVFDLGRPPSSSESIAQPDAAAIDPPGDVDLFRIQPGTGAAKTIVVRVDLLGTAPGNEPPSDFAPIVELFAGDGRPLARSEHRCAWTTTRSRAPIYARVADPTRQGGPNRRYRLVAVFSKPEVCLTAAPGDLVP